MRATLQTRFWRSSRCAYIALALSPMPGLTADLLSPGMQTQAEYALQCAGPASQTITALVSELSPDDKVALAARVRIWNSNLNYLAPAERFLKIDEQICKFIADRRRRAK